MCQSLKMYWSQVLILASAQMLLVHGTTQPLVRADTAESEEETVSEVPECTSEP